MPPHTRHGRWDTTVIPAFGRWRQEDWEVKVLLGYVENLRSAWVIRDHASFFFFLKGKYMFIYSFIISPPKGKPPG